MELVNSNFREAMFFYLGIVLVHEYVHLPDQADDVNYPGEEGNIFEMRVYGREMDFAEARWMIF